MVLSCIHRSISESIVKSVLWIDNATGLWKNLQICFTHSNIFRISDIQEDLYKFRQGNFDVSNYFTQLKFFWDELENYRPIPTCSCVIPCTCGALASVKTYGEQDYVIRFLKERKLHSSISESLITNDNGEEATTLNASHNPGNAGSKNGNNGFKGKNHNFNNSKGYNKESTQQESAAPFFGFTQKQYLNILELLQQSKITTQAKANSIITSPFVLNSHSSNTSGKNSNLWILDTAPCDACHFSKQRRLPFPNDVTHSTAPFEILHADLWGPFSTISIFTYFYMRTISQRHVLDMMRLVSSKGI
ncbi:uncharacterized protein LOC131651273 [Vicia villosa]|uniref:uncharacterized protein LOC131651273 n=1 Tax=Vicia villosa TaxID=3911 RepID=UPI00273BC996|nr:uncharacterized protein LOC131651273 [Vicia villosa]